METLKNLRSVGLFRKSKYGRWARLVGQFTHLLIALGMLILAIVEFSEQRPLFDLLGNYADIPDEVEALFFQNVSSDSSSGLRRAMDLPILGLFVVYFLSVVWLKCWSVWAWLQTACMVGVIIMILTVNLWIQDELPWQFFKARATRILLNTLFISFGWVVVIVTLLSIRNWFPFKLKKSLISPRKERFLLIAWNCLALYLILSLCLIVWFSRLYTSYACVRDREEVHLLCQFTTQIQCWQCQSATTCLNPGECVIGNSSVIDNNNPFHCLSPLYTIPSKDAFCLFNYNIGPFTFISVFGYVGGLYVFTRTSLNALVKCLQLFIFIMYQLVQRFVFRKRPEGTEGDEVEADKISLLVSLPPVYSSTATITASTSQ